MSNEKLEAKNLKMVDENKDDFKESLIERKNLTNTFTIAAIEKHLASLDKMKTEGEGTTKLAQATVDNVLRNNAFIKDMSEKDLHAAHMYWENLMIVKEIKPQLENVLEEIKKHNEYLDVIYEKFGFVKSTPIKVEHGFIKKEDAGQK